MILETCCNIGRFISFTLCVHYFLGASVWASVKQDAGLDWSLWSEPVRLFLGSYKGCLTTGRCVFFNWEDAYKVCDLLTTLFVNYAKEAFVQSQDKPAGPLAVATFWKADMKRNTYQLRSLSSQRLCPESRMVSPCASNHTSQKTDVEGCRAGGTDVGGV